MSIIHFFRLLNLSVNERIALIKFFLVNENNNYLEAKIKMFQNFGDNNIDLKPSQYYRLLHILRKNHISNSFLNIR